MSNVIMATHRVIMVGMVAIVVGKGISGKEKVAG